MLVAARAAQASPAEVFGFGSRSAAQAGAVSASVDDFAAGYYNPAGLAFGSGKRVTFGVLGAASNLKVNERRAPISEPFGMIIGAAAPAPLGGPLADRVHVGVGLYLLPTTVIRVIARQPEEPFYPLYDNRTQRLVVLPVVAVRATNRLAFGAALNLLAGLSGHVIAAEGPTRTVEARVDEEIYTTIKLNAGARWRVHPNIDTALVFRQAFSAPFTTVTDNEVAGEPIDLDIEARGLYTPSQLIAGAAFHLADLDLSADLTWSLWRFYEGPYVQVNSELPLVGPLAGELPEVPYRDTIGVRAGLERRLIVGGCTGLALRAGAAFETSPIPAHQPGVTNLLDGDKVTLAAGAGLLFPSVSGHAIRVDFHLQAQLVTGRTLSKTVAPAGEEPAPFDALRDESTDDPGIQISNPGYPSISSGGQVFSGGLTLSVQM